MLYLAPQLPLTNRFCLSFLWWRWPKANLLCLYNTASTPAHHPCCRWEHSPSVQITDKHCVLCQLTRQRCLLTAAHWLPSSEWMSLSSTQVKKKDYFICFVWDLSLKSKNQWKGKITISWLLLCVLIQDMELVSIILGKSKYTFKQADVVCNWSTQNFIDSL